MRPVGGAAELGVFPAFLWAKHAAWLSLERHTRRVKHSALSCLNAGACRKKKATGIMLISRSVSKRARKTWIGRKRDFLFFTAELALRKRMNAPLVCGTTTVNSQQNSRSITKLPLRFPSQVFPPGLKSARPALTSLCGSLRHDTATCFH